jgi:hypothetical protein
MNFKNQGGSAFPTNEERFPDGVMRQEATYGMTLRDYFAANAMQGFNKIMRDYGWGDEILQEHAKQAYAIADAMLKAREE